MQKTEGFVEGRDELSAYQGRSNRSTAAAAVNGRTTTKLLTSCPERERESERAAIGSATSGDSGEGGKDGKEEREEEQLRKSREFPFLCEVGGDGEIGLFYG